MAKTEADYQPAQFKTLIFKKDTQVEVLEDYRDDLEGISPVGTVIRHEEGKGDYDPEIDSSPEDANYLVNIIKFDDGQERGYANWELEQVKANEVSAAEEDQEQLDLSKQAKPETIQSFQGEFEITPEVEKFISQYNLGNDILRGTGSGEDANPVAHFKPEIVQELARTFDLFVSREPVQEYLDGMEDKLKALVLESAKQVVPDMGDMEVEVVARDRDISTPTSYYEITLKKGDTEEVVDVLEYSFEPGIGVADMATGANWAAWLGIDDSPVYSEDFVNAYDETDWATFARDEADTWENTQWKGDVEYALKNLAKNYTEIFYYIIDHNERGDFLAHVENGNGDSVYEISNRPETNEEGEENEYSSGEIPEVEDGFMKHYKDVDGLEKMLQDNGVIPKKAQIVMGRD